MDCIVDRRDQTDHVYCLTGVIRSFFPSRASFVRCQVCPSYIPLGVVFTCIWVIFRGSIRMIFCGYYHIRFLTAGRTYCNMKPESTF